MNTQCIALQRKTWLLCTKLGFLFWLEPEFYSYTQTADTNDRVNQLTKNQCCNENTKTSESAQILLPEFYGASS